MSGGGSPVAGGLDGGTPPVVLVIGGSDSGAGAGIQADLKTLAAHRVFGATAITAVTAQNTVGVATVYPIPPEIVGAQIDAIASDMAPAAIKTGYLGSAGVVDVVGGRLRRWQVRPVVVDPVLVSTSGARIVDDATLDAYRRLLPVADLATPNFREASILTGRPIPDPGALPAVARSLAEMFGTAVLVTGGHLPGTRATDALSTAAGEVLLLDIDRVTSPHVHGTGCSLAASIAARLAAGSDLESAVRAAKSWVAAAIRGAAAWRLGSGQGPIDHFGWDQAGDT